MSKYKKFSVPTLDALTACVVAFRLSGNSVKRWDGKEPGNKEVVIAHLTGEALLDITDADVEQAQNVKAYIEQKLLMQLLTGANVNSFFNDISKILAEEKVTSSSIGILCWAPKLYSDMTNTEQVRQDVITTCANSRYIGVNEKSVTIGLHILDQVFMRNYERYRYAAHDGNGNLIVFYSPDKFNGVVNVKARVKSHIPSKQYNNLPSTILNYVKAK